MDNALSPYLAGAGIGILNSIAFATAKRPIGVSTPFESTAAALEQKFAPEQTQVNAYLAAREEVPKLDWEWMLAAGIPIGSYLTSRVVGADRSRGAWVPVAWRLRKVAHSPSRYARAFGGAALMMFGARAAKGCTSGHAISGTMQLAASSWLFSVVFGATAVIVARALAGRVS